MLRFSSDNEANTLLWHLLQCATSVAVRISNSCYKPHNCGVNFHRYFLRVFKKYNKNTTCHWVGCKANMWQCNLRRLFLLNANCVWGGLLCCFASCHLRVRCWRAAKIVLRFNQRTVTHDVSTVRDRINLNAFCRPPSKWRYDVSTTASWRRTFRDICPSPNVHMQLYGMSDWLANIDNGWQMMYQKSTSIDCNQQIHSSKQSTMVTVKQQYSRVSKMVRDYKPIVKKSDFSHCLKTAVSMSCDISRGIEFQLAVRMETEWAWCRFWEEWRRYANLISFQFIHTHSCTNRQLYATNVFIPGLPFPGIPGRSHCRIPGN